MSSLETKPQITTKLQTTVEDFHTYETYQLEPDLSKELAVFVMLSIFRHAEAKRSNGSQQREKSRGGSYIYSRFHNIMPDNLEYPLAARRIRAFIPGYNVQEGRGFSSDDHIIGGVQVYRSSRPHYMFEIDYLRSKTRPVRNFYEFVPHKNILMTAQQTAGTDQLFIEPSSPEEIETDIMTFKYWLRELSDAKKQKNGYKEGMRRGRNLPGGMSFTWPLLRNEVQVEPVKNYYPDDLPFGNDRYEYEPGTLAA